MSLRLALSVSALTGSADHVAPKPHIFMVLVDDWGWNDVGYHREAGDREIITPNIDNLAKAGLELDRHYAYSWCAPTRASLQSGRLPVHVSYTADPAATRNPADPDAGFAGIPRNMTGIASKLRAAGYRTHMTGKWDAGMATWDHTPMGRGYETFLGYYNHANDYWNQEVYSALVGAAGGCDMGVDLWNTSGPAHGLNGTGYEEELFSRNTLDILDRHDPSEPLFLFHSFHIVHTPLQVPGAYENMFAHLDNQDMRRYAAMVHYMDEQVGKFVAKFKERGLWDNTLMVLCSDNGGPIYGGPLFGHQHGGASNAPLRGGKLSDWEGGVRVNAFVAGGFLPESRRGTVSEDLVHMADWYTTFCHIAGVDATDERAARARLPAVDGVNLWPVISGQKGDRTEIHVSEMTLIQGRYKLLTGGLEQLEAKNGLLFPLPVLLMDGKWPGYGLRSTVETVTRVRYCHHGCLFDIFSDPGEEVDLARETRGVGREQYRQLREGMLARLAELNKSLFTPNRGKADPAACDQIIANGGFFGPWIDVLDSGAAVPTFV